MGKKLDLGKTVYELCRENPEVVEILREAGFREVGDPVVCATAGRVMTLPRGARLRGISLEKTIERFVERGYEVTGRTEGAST